MDGKITISASTLDEAITKALIELQTTSEHLHYEVVQKESAGLLGIFGKKPCIIRAHVMSEAEEKAAAEAKKAEEARKAAAAEAARKAEAEKKANEILERAKNGEDFDALIKEYNEDPGMESNQDGYFFTDGEMVSEFGDATKSIEPGEITMCKSDYGYHIIKRLPIDESDSKFSEYLENNKSAVQSAVTSKKQEEALEKKAEELGIKVEVNQDKIDKMVIQPKDTPEPTAEAK